jgi:outer membrane receptor for ferrienterochelin and colicins
LKEQVFFQGSYNWHKQDSYYGFRPFMATQQVLFAQLYWQKRLTKAHELLLGAAYRYTYYDDNTPGTLSADGLHNMPAKTPLPGLFIQDEWKLNSHHTLLAGYRYDYNRYHGNIHSPRLAYKFAPNDNNTLRASFGTGFRVVNLFTEDHSALTGAREVVIENALKPERSLNGNLNYVRKIPARRYFLNLDATAFYSYFTNKIVGDFDTDPNKIIYDNLDGYAVSRGIALNTDLVCSVPLKFALGITYMDVFLMRNNSQGELYRTEQLHAPRWSGTFTVNYQFPRQRISIDLTGQWKGPMRLPVLPNDYRPDYSPWYCIANIQVTRKFRNGIEVYGGVKNLLNFVPRYALMRPFDPFDKHVQDPVNNPEGYSFDTGYNYASLQGIRGFLGVRYNLY